MSRRPRKNHSAAFKAKAALAAVKRDETLAELAEQFDVHADQITQWKTPLLEGATDVFGEVHAVQASVGLKAQHASSQADLHALLDLQSPANVAPGYQRSPTIG